MPRRPKKAILRKNPQGLTPDQEEAFGARQLQGGKAGSGEVAAFLG